MCAQPSIPNERVNPYAPSLTQLYFYLTEGCNLACRHCWLTPKLDPTGERYPVLAVDRFICAITEARYLGLETVKLTGGEPLLHPAFLNLLDIVRREGLEVMIETNGVLMTPRIASAIASLPGKFVSVSLDGTNAETHEWVRGVRGSFEATLQGIHHLVEAGVRPQIIMSLMRCNAHQISDMIHLAEQVGAGSLKFNLVQPTARGEVLHRMGQALRMEELVQLGQHVYLELAPTTDLSLYFDLPLAFRPLSSMANGDGCWTCGIFNILGVLPTGHYALCGIGERIPDLVFGEVGMDALSDVWLGNMMLQSLRANVPDHLRGVCEGCFMRAQCLGACIAQNYYQSGDVTSPYWFCQEAYEMGLFPVSRLQKTPVGEELLVA
jgi:SynChlorMet cassette radical SAM/SPASM protein ScmF